MLPASFQTPAAVILVIGGLLSCFAGYRIFRVVLGIYGFLLGAGLASTMAGADQRVWMIVAAIAGGVIGALILIAAYFVGVALLGAGVGAFAANLIWAAMGREPHVAAVIALSILGALLALWLQRLVIILATGFGGAWTALVGALVLMGNEAARQAAAKNDVWIAYPLDPAPGQQWVIFVWLALGVAGVLVQLAVTGRKKK